MQASQAPGPSSWGLTSPIPRGAVSASLGLTSTHSDPYSTRRSGSQAAGTVTTAVRPLEWNSGSLPGIRIAPSRRSLMVPVTSRCQRLAGPKMPHRR